MTFGQLIIIKVFFIVKAFFIKPKPIYISGHQVGLYFGMCNFISTLFYWLTVSRLYVVSKKFTFDISPLDFVVLSLKEKYKLEKQLFGEMKALTEEEFMTFYESTG